MAADRRPRRGRDRLARVVYVGAPALAAAVVLAVGLGLIGAPAAEPELPDPALTRAAKAELSSPPLKPVVSFAPGEEPGTARPRPSSGRRPGVPIRLSIPAARVRAQVSSVGATRRGVEVPAAGRTGWYRAGPRPGEPGRAVVIGHVDSRHGPAVFARLGGLRRGDAIEVGDARRGVHRYRVVTKERVAKTRFPRADVFGPTGRTVLVLVTCGGPFEPRRGYRDNLIVYARAG